MSKILFITLKIYNRGEVIMKQYDVKCLNKRILEAMEKNVPVNIERLDNDGFEYMLYELANEELSLLTFEALADIYKAQYKFTLMYGNPNSTTITTVTEKDTLWATLYEIYKEHTGEGIQIYNRTFKELVELFGNLNIIIIFE